MKNGDGDTVLSQLTTDDLQTMRKAFQDVTNATKGNYLTKPQFSEFMKAHLDVGTVGEYDEIFDLVDVTREGIISWDMFSNHLMLQYYEQDDRTKHAKIPSWFPSKLVPMPHKSFICKTLFINGKYFTAGRDGLLCLLDQNFHVKNTYQILTNPDEIRAKDLWITDACYLSNVNKIAFATTSREILIYEIQSNKKSFVLCFRLGGFHFIPMCLNYWVNPSNTLQSVLSSGGTGGEVHAFFFTLTNNNSLFEPHQENLLQSENGQKICQTININSLKKKSNKNIQYLTHNEHSSWVRQVSYFPSLDCFMSCSTNSKESLIIAWVGKGRRSFRSVKFSIGLGLSSFDFHEKLNIIATGGIDNLICLWNPYVAAKPNGVLRGHVQAIISVKFVKNRNVLLSVSKDKILRVWDVQLQMCLQRLTGLFTLNKTSVDFNFQMAFDDENLILLSAINSNFYSMKMKSEIHDKVITHDASVTNLICNEKFNQVITVCEDSVISIWYLNTGQKIKSISNAHSGNEITAVALDHSKTHFLTGATDGLIKIWDANGSCLNVLICSNYEPCEITQIIWSKRSIFAVGWSKNICVFNVSDLKNYYVQPTTWKGKQKHYDDIFLLHLFDSKYLVSASYDAHVVFWNVNSHNPIRKLFASDGKPNRKPLILPPIVSKSPRNSISNTEIKRNLSLPTNSLRRLSIPEKSSRPNSNESSDRAEASTISSLCLLSSRDPSDENVANIFVTHTDGSLTFWNTQTCQKLDTYHAFNFNGSIVSCVNSDETIAGLGSETGVVKLVDLLPLCNSTTYAEHVDDHSENTDKNLPARAILFHHDDVITSISLIDKLTALFVLTSSADFTVSLHCNEQLVGVFGSDKHWNLNDVVDNITANVTEHVIDSSQHLEMSSKDKQSNDNIDKNLVLNDNLPQSLTNVDDITDITDVMFDQLLLSDTWQQTSLGKTYQNKGKRKMRKSHLTSKSCFQTSYMNLPTNEIPDIGIIEKPDFVLHPEKYFMKRDSIDSDFKNLNQSDSIKETDLKFVHDERNFFPKYIIEREVKRRAVTNITTYSNPRSKISFKPPSIKSNTRQSSRITR